MPSRFWILLFFFLSGITGLLYEVVWTRLLTLVMGNTHYAVSTVLTAFMGGLALGSFVGGWWIDRTGNSLRTYAVLELGIGVYCFLIPSLIETAFPIFQWIYIHHPDSYLQASFLRFLVCGGILIVPTTFMGATLPVLGKFISRDSQFIGREVGTLFSINTFGAVVGALTSAFVFMPWLGLRGTIWLAAMVNVAIAINILIIFRGQDPSAPNEPEDVGVSKMQTERLTGWFRWMVLGVFGVSGACALIYQVAWNRLFSLVLGSSVYAFSLIVTTFILGLALGAIAFSRWCERFSDPLKVLGILQAGIGVSALVLLPFYGKIPLWNRWGYESLGANFGTVQGTNFGIIFLFLFIPTFIMGGQFPVVVKLISGSLSRVGRHVGAVYAANTVGTILGSFIGGFFLIPLIGIQKAILVAVFLNVVFGLGLLAVVPSVSLNAKVYVVPAVFILCILQARSISSWDNAILSSGSYMPYRIKDLDKAIRKTNKILFYREGLHTTVTTELAVSGNIFLRVNGKIDASLALDMRTQLLSGYLPMFLHKDPRSVLVIGLGSGITLGAVEQFPAKQIDLVEISQAVIDGSRYFDPFNHRALEDQRVGVLLEDGRNHVALTDRSYDVIISEPSNPWISGVGTLFTREFFRLLRERLNPGGIVCIWVHTNLSPASFKSIVKTYRQIFPHVTMWESIVGDDYLLIGSDNSYRLQYENVRSLLGEPAIQDDLKKIGIASLADLVSLLLMSEGGLDRFSEGAQVHTDDNLLLEFRSPAYIYKDERAKLVRELSPFFKIDTDLIAFSKTDTEERERILKTLSSLERSQSQVAEIKKQARVQRLLEEAEAAFNRGRVKEAERKFAEILMIEPKHPMAYLNLGKVYQAQNKLERAEWAYQRSVEINPFYVFGSIALAKVHIVSGQAVEAKNILQEMLSWYPRDPEVWVYLGLAYSFTKEPEKAQKRFEHAITLDPLYALAHYYLGVHHANSRPRQAARHLETFLKVANERRDSKLVQKAKKLLNKFKF